MTLSDERTRTAAAAPRTATLTALQVTAVLTLLSVAFQFVTAGELLANHGGALDVHGGGAIALHVISGLTAIAAIMHWRRRGTTVLPAATAAVVFVLTFIQAELGDRGIMWAHVPCAMLLTVGAVWVAAWSFGRGARR
jgi:hypothetical protein